MVDINKMARAAGIGSAVGAVGGIIKTANDSEPDTSSNILGGIVGGALVGSVGGAGISAGRQYLQAKRLANAAGSDIVEAAAKQASKAQKPTQSSVINNAQDLDVAKNVMNFKIGDSAISIPKLSDPNSLSGSQIKEFAHMDAINYRSQLRKIDNLSGKDIQNATNIASLKLSSQFNDVDMQRKYQNYFREGIEGSVAKESKYTTKQTPIQTKPAHVNSTQNGTIEKLIDDYYGPGTSADEYVRNKLNKSFTETKRFRKWHIGDPYSDGEIGTDLEIRQRKSNGVFEIKEHSFFADDPEYYSKPTKWEPYKFS
jgi:hypothetical protein